MSQTLDTMIKHPGKISYTILEARRTGVAWHMALIFAISVFAYGMIMGSFSGGWQWLHAPLSLLAGWIISGLICLPSLHIFTSLGGGRQSLPDSAGLLLQAMSLHSIVLIGFAPVSFIFAQATDGSLFMGTLHMAAWLIGALFSLKTIRYAFRLYNGQNSFLILWCVIFLLVAMQMSTTLRPLVDTYDGTSLLAEKKFFLQHWKEQLFYR